MATKEQDNAAEAKPAKPAKEGAPKKEGKGGGGKKAKEPTGPAPKYKREKPPRLRAVYETTVKGNMMKEFSYSSIMQVPRLVKITLNMGLGKANQDAKIIDNA